MMQILLTAATKFEIELFIHNKKIDILIAGAGIPNTLYNIQKKLQKKKYNMVIQAGIAGCFHTQYPLGEVFIINQDAFADIGVEENGNFKTLFEMGLADKDEFPFENGYLVNKNGNFKNLVLPTAKAVTVNKITDNPQQIEQLVKKYEPLLESMEGAAFHYVCLQEQIPFLQIRSISNYVGERDKTKWDMDKAIRQLNVALEKIIHQFCAK